jgi:2'-5' RNA ligase
MSDEPLRTFVAVEIGPEVRKAATELIKKFRALRADVKWVEPHNLHITLKFLGEVPEPQTEEICQVVTAVAAETAPFEFELRGAGVFPHLGRPRTIWLGVGEGHEALVALHRQIDKALAKLGFAAESRPPEPHLTIGRVRSGGPAITELGTLLLSHANFSVGKTTARDVVVFSSLLEQVGPTYEALGRAELCGK